MRGVQVDTSVFLMDTTTKNPAESVKHLMDEAGLTVLSLSTKTGIARTTLNRRLLDPQSFTVRELRAVAEALGTSVTGLFEKDTVPA